jgi:hypothetical protein
MYIVTLWKLRQLWSIHWIKQWVKGTWRYSSLAGDPGVEVEKSLKMGVCFHRGPVGEPRRMLIYRRLWEMDVGGSRNGVSLSEEAQCSGPLGRAPLLGTPKDTLGLLFLESEDITDVSLGAIWNFGKVIGFPWFEIGQQRACQLRPRCIGAARTWTQLQSIK